MTPSTKEYSGDVKNLNIFLLNFPIFNSLEADDLNFIKQNSLVKEFKAEGNLIYLRALPARGALQSGG